MRNIIIASVFFPILCFAQPKKERKISQDSTIRKWQKAVVHLEGLMPTFNFNQILQYINKVKLDSGGNISDDTRTQIQFFLLRQKNMVTGTGIYIKDNNKRYLVTAKHVVYDPALTADIEHNRQMSKDTSTKYRELFCDLLSIVTPYDIYLQGKANNKAVFLSYGSFDNAPYEFSPDSLDIALISLQSQRAKKLREILDSNGYEPIDINEIDNKNNFNGWSDIFAIGFPEISQLNNAPVYDGGRWENNIASVPLVTFGKLASFHPKLPKFFADITIYPGNSGGPVISNGKLIGIVIQQVALPTFTNSSSSDRSILSRGNLAIAVKSSEIFRYLKILQERESSTTFLNEE